MKKHNSVTADEACDRAAKWLHLGNLASERGDKALAERHYARSRKWQDLMNELLLGNAYVKLMKVRSSRMAAAGW